jgi:hypothetical protein
MKKNIIKDDPLYKTIYSIYSKVSILLAMLQGFGDVTGRTAMNYCNGHTERFEVSPNMNPINVQSYSVITNSVLMNTRL